MNSNLPAQPMKHFTILPLNFLNFTDHNFPILTRIQYILIQHKSAQSKWRIDHRFHLQHLMVVQHIRNIVSDFDIFH